MVSKLFHFLFTKKIEDFNCSGNSPFYIFDIDNTLADTWPLLKLKTKLSWYQYFFINPLQGSKYYFHKTVKKSPVLFISTRHWVYYFPTYFWLFRNGFFNRGSKLILTRNSEEKLFYIKKILPKFKEQIYFYDDMSYGHETGEIKFFNETITKISTMNINYYGYYFIQYINFNV